MKTHSALNTPKTAVQLDGQDASRCRSCMPWRVALAILQQTTWRELRDHGMSAAAASEPELPADV